MQESSSNEPSESKAVDLNSLKDLSFGPNWGSSDKTPRKSDSREHRSRMRSHEDARDPRKDRRKGGSQPRASKAPGGRSRGTPKQREETFKPVVQVLFYPEDTPFEKLAKAMRASCRTYELFEIAQLILQKQERFITVIKPLQRVEGSPQSFYCTVPENIPYESEDEAVNEVLKARLSDFATIEEVEVEPPKGSFAFVYKCPFTGTLLGPPNYHRYQSILREHHAAKVANMPLDRYSQKLEKVSDEETIQQWVQSMSKQQRYRVEKEGEEPLTFETLESLRLHLLATRREDIVKHYDTVRMSGAMLEQMPAGNLRRSIESTLEHQRQFPLDTANNLRGRLRRMKFNIYKRGSKGVSYVCAVKRNFRNESTVFSDSIQTLVEFIEAHPNIAVSDLPEQYLGVTLPQETTPAATSGETASAANEPQEGSSADSPKPLSPEEQAKLSRLMQDLRWLVSEGFVTEYGDGKLFAQPVMTQPQQADDDQGDQPEDNPTSTTPTTQAELSSAPETQPTQSPPPEASSSEPQQEEPRKPDGEA